MPQKNERKSCELKPVGSPVLRSPVISRSVSPASVSGEYGERVEGGRGEREGERGWKGGEGRERGRERRGEGRVEGKEEGMREE